ncbi:MAG TPA: 2,3-diphosphoglycerate-dependent phosphoglycerate mutase [Acidimicrobiales bacterium]|nr:2,3-diphosphoglycerate-dependent phosphoglycerate mutase [Acidimicrobiales bacterium]
MTYTLVLLRHGESTWNQENLFTGWHDVPLSERGATEAAAAGATLRAEGLSFDKVHTSVLLRAVQTADLALDALGQLWLPVDRSWRLNERHYGALQGLNKKQTAEQHGLEQVKLWRRSYDVPPPPLAPDSPEHPRHDARYARLAPDVLPATECLADVVVRVLPYWYDAIVPDLRAGLRVLVVAHGNSLRALLKHLEGVSDTDIAGVDIPTGIPRLYSLGPGFEVESVRYLGDADAAEAAAEAVRRQAG